MKGIKASTDEGGVRSPFFIRWPGKIRPGIRVTEIAGAIDLLPTLTTLAGIDLKSEKPLDGKDVSPLFMGSVRNWPDRMIFSHQNGRVSVRTRQYRLDDRGALFDMNADPGQTRDIAPEKPDVSVKLTGAVAQWRMDVLGGQNQPKDDRPYPVGYSEFPMTLLPARDGLPHGGVKRSAGAPNCSYFVNWTALDDSMTWDVDVKTAGRYAVTIYYTCKEGDEGSTIELSLNTSKITRRVQPAWDPPLYTNQDTIPRPRAESQMKEFRPLDLGIMHLDKGRRLLTLKATQIPGKSVMDVRQIVLTLAEGQ
jgi:N-sulfoglucosamine sulfohydrolase-like protein